MSAAKRPGTVFAAFLKLLMPLIVVVPGIAAVMLASGLEKPGQAYPTMLRYLLSGILGLVFPALVAAIIASTASKINLIATIFTLDIYAKFKRDPNVRVQASDVADAAVDENAPGQALRERELVRAGQITALGATAIAIILTRPLLGSFEQGFQFIQGFTGFFTPGIVVMFMLCLSWKRAAEAGALMAGVASVLLSGRVTILAGIAVHEPHGAGLLRLACPTCAAGG